MGSQEDEYRLMAEEAYQDALMQRTDIQNDLISNAESDIRIVKHKIDDMKEEDRQFDDEADFTDRLETLYVELGKHEHRLTMIKMYPYNSPIIIDTTCHNPFAEALVSGILGDDEGAMKMTPIDYDEQLDRLNKSLGDVDDDSDIYKM